jgi:hypothetical protein
MVMSLTARRATVQSDGRPLGLPGTSTGEAGEGFATDPADSDREQPWVR